MTGGYLASVHSAPGVRDESTRGQMKVGEAAAAAAARKDEWREKTRIAAEESDARKEAPGLLREQDDRVVCRSIAGEMHRTPRRGVRGWVSKET